MPAGLVRLVERLLEKDAELRPENAALVREVLAPLALEPDATAALLAPHWQAMDPVARLRALLPERAPATPAPAPRRQPRLPEAMDVFGIHADPPSAGTKDAVPSFGPNWTPSSSTSTGSTATTPPTSWTPSTSPATTT